MNEQRMFYTRTSEEKSPHPPGRVRLSKVCGSSLQKNMSRLLHASRHGGHSNHFANLLCCDLHPIQRTQTHGRRVVLFGAPGECILQCDATLYIERIRARVQHIRGNTTHVPTDKRVFLRRRGRGGQRVRGATNADRANVDGERFNNMPRSGIYNGVHSSQGVEEKHP